jgi:hypothetical protein
LDVDDKKGDKMIGLKVTLKQNCLGNKINTVGYVFNLYPDFDRKDKVGIQVIFENGNYDGFSVEEQKLFLKMGKIDPRYSNYVFRSVAQVNYDFYDGYWNFEGE